MGAPGVPGTMSIDEAVESKLEPIVFEEDKALCCSVQEQSTALCECFELHSA